MANHRKEVKTLSSLSKRQWIKMGSIVMAIVVALSAGIICMHVHNTKKAAQEAKVAEATAFSATGPEARGVADRGSAKGSTYVTVTINGKSRAVIGTHFTTIKSVLEQGNITLEPGDAVHPSLDSKVKESTTITVERTGADLQTADSPIPFNTVRKETKDLPKGQEKVESEGQDGVMETTSLITRAGDQITSSNIFTSAVKTAPVDRVILVGTGATATISAADKNIGTTTPVGEMQQWTHDYLLSNGHSEADFTATVYIISHESGWRVNAQNPSGAYGLPQSLPGSKMASMGADWATNYQTQLKWFFNYCNGRYGSIQGAYQYWLSHHNY